MRLVEAQGRRRLHRPARRGVQLLAGLVLYGVSIALMVHAGLGVMPWSVLDQGVAVQTGLPLGVVTILTGAVILLCWIPMRERPGVGTVANVVVIGLVLDATLALLAHAPVDHLGGRSALVVSGVGLNGVATAAYIGARLGPGPRDGLMTGLVRLTGGSVRLVRTGIEVVVVLLGAALGGTVGVGTLAYALAIGPLVHTLLPRLSVVAAGPDLRPAASSARSGQ